MFSAVSSVIMVQKAWTPVEIKQYAVAPPPPQDNTPPVQSTQIEVKGYEADKYPCEKHYPRKEVSRCHVAELALGALAAAAILTKLEDMPDIEINPGMPDVDFEMEIPEDMVANLGDLLDGAGAVCGSAFDAAGEMI